MAVAKRQQRFDLSGTWNLTETEGIDGFIADLNMNWLKRKAATAALGASRNPRRFQHADDRVTSAVQRKGVWQEDEFVADGQRVEKDGAWKVRYWDDEGCLVDEGANHEGHLRTRFRLLDANTMEMRVCIVRDPPTGNAMVRRYSRDGEPLGGIAPRLPDELQGGDDASTAAPSGGAFHTVVTVDQIVAAKEQQRIAKMVESTEKDEGDRIAKLVAEQAASEQGALAEDAKGLTDSSVTHEQCADDDAPAVVSPAAPSLPPVTGGDRAERPPVEAPSPAPVPQPAAAPHAHKQRRGGELVRVGMSVLVIIALLAAVWRRRVLRFLTRGR